VISLLGLAGCPPDDGFGDPIDPTVTYEEDDDEENDDFQDPEEVDLVWTTRLVIEGSARECDWDDDEDWPWIGDLDNYEITIPSRGFIEATLEWEDDLDIDLIQIVETDGGFGEGESSRNNDRGPGDENILFEEEFREDEEVHLQVACAVGSGGDYTLELIWED
jgi:hypothetical protein